jgi:hypothetical protein
MTMEFIAIWFFGTIGVMMGVLAGNLWLDRISRRKRTRKIILRRLKEV